MNYLPDDETIEKEAAEIKQREAVARRVKLKELRKSKEYASSVERMRLEKDSLHSQE